ncbi:hypothetical protein DUNSADRAFT_514 [Dunaliella salina]|uniref:Encoded protein n=1 Tax=Dunaliella salina TaxID=3046 RepID=A0ABQ7GY64_DUNSA|nr:hypothetical protein DUNSADRAFT_514 [Dunaliella salina]|eukprot:KAF5839541.1 hypothetical protein DUNSADRAFT_514 [Dunaliella salina]
MLHRLPKQVNPGCGNKGKRALTLGSAASSRRSASKTSNAPPSSAQQREARLTLLEEERNAALETAIACSRRSRHLLTRVQNLKRYAKERLARNDGSTAASTLQTKERVHECLEQTINRAQNNYRLAVKLGEFIGYLQQDLADDEPLLTERGPQLPMTSASQPEIIQASSWVSPTMACRDDEATPGQVDDDLASALRGQEDDSVHSRQKDDIFHSRQKDERFHSRQKDERFHSRQMRSPQQPLQQKGSAGSASQPPHSDTQDEGVLADVRRAVLATRGSRPQALRMLDDVCDRLQQELSFSSGRDSKYKVDRTG